MRIVTWNLNHRTCTKEIRLDVAEAVLSLDPDIVVFTEFVEGDSSKRFFSDRSRLRELFRAYGIKYTNISTYTPNHNQVMIASRYNIQVGNILAPNIHPAMPSNINHVMVPDFGLELIGLRIPAFKASSEKRTCWEWVLHEASTLKGTKAIIIGDLNTDIGANKTTCSNCMVRLGEMFNHVSVEGESYFRQGVGYSRLDHAFVTTNINVLGSQYVPTKDDYIFAGINGLSDHAPLIIEVELSI